MKYFWLISCLWIVPLLAHAQVIDDHPEELQNIDIVDRLGETISTEYTFINSEGNEVLLKDYFHKDKPVILTLVYYRCPMLCTFVLNSLVESLDQLTTMNPGEDFELVTISINPEEDAEVAKSKQETYLDLFKNKPKNNIQWHFLTSPDNQIQKLADELGFTYFYDEDIEEYAHPAVVYMLTEEGVISRNIYGLTYPSKDIRFGLLEASEGKIGNVIEKILLYCYKYDPEAGGYILFAKNTMKVAGIFTIFILGGFLGIMWRFEKGNKGDNNNA